MEIIRQEIRERLQRAVELNGFGKVHGGVEQAVVQEADESPQQVGRLGGAGEGAGFDVGGGGDVQGLGGAEFAGVPEEVVGGEGFVSGWVVRREGVAVAAEVDVSLTMEKGG